MNFQWIATWHNRFAIIFLNAVILFATLLAIMHFLLEAKHVPPESNKVYSRLFDMASYKLISQDEAVQTGQEFDQMGEQESYAFNPWTTFQERPFAGNLVTVKHGFSSNVRGTKAPVPAKVGQKDLIIWTFGGSTMFGWGVPDSQTIASYLQDQLQELMPAYHVQVTNHGHSYYFSSLEVSLYVALLRTEKKPDIVLFLDGLNDSIWLAQGWTAPQFAGAMITAWETERQRRFSEDHNWINIDQVFPLQRITQYICANSSLPKKNTNSLLQENNPYIRETPNPSQTILQTYRLNRDMAASISALSDGCST